MGKKRFVLFSSCLMFSFVLMLVVAALNGFAISHTDAASVHAPVNHLKSRQVFTTRLLVPASIVYSLDAKTGSIVYSSPTVV